MRLISKKFAFMLVLVSTTGFCQPTRTENITADSLGENWPLTVDVGNIRCTNLYPGSRTPIYSATFIAPGGKEYALNGVAEGQGHPDIDPIWRDDPEIEGAKVNIGKLIKRALALCN